MISIFLFIFVLILIATCVFQEATNRMLKKENKALEETLDNEIKDYDALKEENLYLYQQLKEYQDKELEKETKKKTATKKTTAKKETTKKATTTKKVATKKITKK